MMQKLEQRATSLCGNYHQGKEFSSSLCPVIYIVHFSCFKFEFFLTLIAISGKGRNILASSSTMLSLTVRKSNMISKNNNFQVYVSLSSVTTFIVIHPISTPNHLLAAGICGF